MEVRKFFAAFFIELRKKFFGGDWGQNWPLPG